MFSVPTTTTSPAAQQQRPPSHPLPLAADQKPPAEEPPLESMTVTELRAIAKQRGVVPDGDKRHQSTWVRAIQQHQERQAQQKTSAEEAADLDLGALTIAVDTDVETREVSAHRTDAVLDAIAAAFGRPVRHIEEAILGDDAVQAGESFEQWGIEVPVAACCLPLALTLATHGLVVV